MEDTLAGSVVSKNRMENAAEQRVAGLKAEIQSLEEQLQSFTAVDPSRFESRVLVPARAHVKVLRTALLWVY